MIFLLLLISPIIGFAVDLIAPSLPAIAQYFQSSKKIAGDLISLYILGYGLGNFLVGFLSDAWGRQLRILKMICCWDGRQCSGQTTPRYIIQTECVTTGHWIFL